MTNSYICIKCKYSTNRLFNYNKHIASKKHKGNQLKSSILDYLKKDDKHLKKDNFHPKKDDLKSSKLDGLRCECCNRFIKHKSNYSRHYKLCKERRKKEQEILIDELKKEKELNEKQAEELEELKKKYNQMLEDVVKGRLKGKVINNININYVKTNFQDAYNFEDLMNVPLTEEEKTKILESGPTAGCLNLITSRCVDNIDDKKRPLHCVDTSRKNTF